MICLALNSDFIEYILDFSFQILFFYKHSLYPSSISQASSISQRKLHLARHASFRRYCLHYIRQNLIHIKLASLTKEHTLVHFASKLHFAEHAPFRRASSISQSQLHFAAPFRRASFISPLLYSLLSATDFIFKIKPSVMALNFFPCGMCAV